LISRTSAQPLTKPNVTTFSHITLTARTCRTCPTICTTHSTHFTQESAEYSWIPNQDPVRPKYLTRKRHRTNHSQRGFRRSRNPSTPQILHNNVQRLHDIVAWRTLVHPCPPTKASEGPTCPGTLRISTSCRRSRICSPIQYPPRTSPTSSTPTSWTSIATERQRRLQLAHRLRYQF